MSWLFGYRNSQPPQDFSQFIQPPPASGSGDGGGSGESPKITRSQMEAYRFDSGALERAATAAKELERSSTLSLFHSFSTRNHMHNYVNVCFEVRTRACERTPRVK